MATGSKKKIDVENLPSPPELDESSVIKESKTVTVPFASKTLKIYTEQARKKDVEPRLDVLLLHGQSFTSKNWMDIKTVPYIANWGYRAFAVDLPGYGKSVDTVGLEHSGAFLGALISALGLDRPVIVSPSMSGGFSLPYLFDDPATSTERARAYVPVAPVHTSKYVTQFKKSQIPTLDVVGTEDKGIGIVSTKDLKNLPHCQHAPMKGARHACYMNNPDAWHKLLYHYLQQIDH